MRNEIELESIIEDYLMGKLSQAEATAFEQLRSTDPSVDHKVVAHKFFLDSLKEYGQVLSLKEQMNAAHQQMDTAQLTEELKPHPSLLINLWRKNKSAIAIAASFVLLAMVAVYSVQHNTKQNGSYEMMRRELAKIQKSQSTLIRNFKNSSKADTAPVRPAKFGGTGFALTPNGYLCTNLHVINGADSVYVQNSKGDSFKAKVVYQDPQYDIAIIKIVDKDFSSLSALPYKLKRNSIGMGENVYTLGFPKDDAVLGEGYISSRTGHAGDTTAYQVSIPVNPGNSGGPLLDNQGNVIGVISAKENQVDGAAFAVKSKYVLDALNAIPSDSLGRKTASVKRSPLQGLTRTKQVAKIQDYVFMIKVYN
ncbi:S1C family serine protease [Pedobacter nutrimenti]|jgi:S1-C subfamily serine protease|uniref:Trypsin-like peptidase n=1 Tax=Pedobacter nutrimenti TaxID=1241337 RepID=A0A318UBD4_9SPHI|nr:serine protease [Pedobacter nutrimenti]PYF72720.1 trypsin-like peptidase [Pedobacter nutrimenti]